MAGEPLLLRAHPPGRPDGLYLEVRLAALLVAYAGRLPVAEARRLARSIGLDGPAGRKPNGSNRGSRAGLAVHGALKKLSAEGLARRDGDHLVADDLLGLADYIADRLDASDE